MTEDDLDLLASAYLDGEATSEEVATVERDPDLLARVQRLRAVSGQVGAPVNPPTAALKEQHLAAALAQFDLVVDPVGDGVGGVAAEAATAVGAAEVTADPTVQMAEGNVFDLSDRAGRAGRPRSSASRRAARAERRSGPRAMPQWLGAAAALLLIGGGAIWVAGQSRSDNTEAASFDTQEGSDGSDSAADAEPTTAQAESAGEAMMAQADEAMEEETAEAAAEPAAEDAAADRAETAADSEAGDTAARSTTTGVAPNNGGFFPEDPVESYSALPDLDGILDELPPPRTDLSTSRCGTAAELPTGSEPIGYLPIQIEGRPAELFVVVDQDGAESTIIVDDGCEQLLP